MLRRACGREDEMSTICSTRWIQTLCSVAAACLVLRCSRRRASRTTRFPFGRLAAPLAKGAGPDDTPSILLYLPSSHQPTPGIVVCPSGSYMALSMDHDGRQVAEWLNNLGIAAFVLKYRLAPAYRYPVPLLDAQRALRYVRSNASLYNVIENQIGIMGFSAGGHLAAMAATHFDAGRASPSDGIDRDELAPGFPGSRLSRDYLLRALPCTRCRVRNLLGDHPDPNLAAVVSDEKHVTPKRRPRFFSTPTTTPRFPWKTAWPSSPPCARRAFPRNFIFTSTVCTAWAWRRTIPCSPPGRAFGELVSRARVASEECVAVKLSMASHQSSVGSGRSYISFLHRCGKCPYPALRRKLRRTGSRLRTRKPSAGKS